MPLAEDNAEKLLAFMAAAVAAGAYDPVAQTFTTAVAGSLQVTGNADVDGTLGVDGTATFDGAVVVGGEVQAASLEVDGNLGLYGTEPAAKQAVTGALSTVADAPAKAVLTSIIGALSTVGQVTNSTT